jgi:hypothetical protein
MNYFILYVRFGTKFLIYFEPAHGTEIMSSSFPSTSNKIIVKIEEQKAIVRRENRHENGHEGIQKR